MQAPASDYILIYQRKVSLNHFSTFSTEYSPPLYRLLADAGTALFSRYRFQGPTCASYAYFAEGEKSYALLEYC